MVEKLNGQSCIQFISKHIDKALEKCMPSLDEDQCDNTLQSESLETMLGIISKCFSTDRGVILLENHLLFFQDARTEEQQEAWYKETVEEWTRIIDSNMVESFSSALRIWMISQLDT